MPQSHKQKRSRWKELHPGGRAANGGVGAGRGGAVREACRLTASDTGSSRNRSGWSGCDSRVGPECEGRARPTGPVTFGRTVSGTSGRRRSPGGAPPGEESGGEAPGPAWTSDGDLRRETGPARKDPGLAPSSAQVSGIRAPRRGSPAAAAAPAASSPHSPQRRPTAAALVDPAGWSRPAGEAPPEVTWPAPPPAALEIGRHVSVAGCSRRCTPKISSFLYSRRNIHPQSPEITQKAKRMLTGQRSPF